MFYSSINYNQIASNPNSKIKSNNQNQKEQIE